MSHPFGTALVVEAQKLRASRVVLAASLLLVVGISVLVGAMTAAAEAGNEQILSQLGAIADGDGWERFWGVSAQVTAAAGLLCFGVVLAWVVGREFTDGTITGLFAITVPRATIALAKLAVTVWWSAAVAVGLTACLVVTGTLVVGAPDAEALAGLARLLVLTVLSGLLATPTAWAATLGRGLLPGIAVAVTMMATAQVFAVAGTGAWFPVAAPALWAIDPTSVSLPQLTLVALVPIGATLLTTRAWSRLQLDR